MVRSYVYRCEHKITKRFYIGYRKANLAHAYADFGTYYFTSCPEVSNHFGDFTYNIIGEFRYPATAFEVEQKLIFESRHNPLLVNKHWQNIQILISQDVTIRSLANHVTRIDPVTGSTKLVKKRSKSKKIYVPSERERLGITYKELKEHAVVQGEY